MAIWQTQTLRSEHSEGCAGLCGEREGEHCGLQSETGEKICINKRDETVAKCQGTTRNNKNLATSIYAALMGVA